MIGRKGKGPGEYIDPDDISIDRENKKIYVLDSQTQNVLKYSGNGTFESSFKLENKGTRSTFIQPFKNALYTNLYTFDKSGKRFLLSKVDVTNGKRILFNLRLLSIIKVGMNYSALINILLSPVLPEIPNLCRSSWIQYLK